MWLECYEFEFNEFCVQFVVYYGCGFEVVCLGKLKDKVSVENMVSIVYKCVYVLLCNDFFYSFSELNYVIVQVVVVYNCLVF